MELQTIQAPEARWQATEPARIESAIGVLTGGIDTLRGIQSQLGLEWYQKKFGPLPVWAWGAIGGVAMIGGAVLLKKKKPVVSAASSKKLVSNRRK